MAVEGLFFLFSSTWSLYFPSMSQVWKSKGKKQSGRTFFFTLFYSCLKMGNFNLVQSEGGNLGVARLQCQIEIID